MIDFTSRALQELHADLIMITDDNATEVDVWSVPTHDDMLKRQQELFTEILVLEEQGKQEIASHLRNRVYYPLTTVTLLRSVVEDTDKLTRFDIARALAPILRTIKYELPKLGIRWWK